MLQVIYHGGTMALDFSQILGAHLEQTSPWWWGWFGMASRWQLTILTRGEPLCWTLTYVPGLVNYHRVLRGLEAARAGRGYDVVLV